jgi:hypothetical protein
MAHTMAAGAPVAARNTAHHHTRWLPSWQCQVGSYILPFLLPLPVAVAKSIRLWTIEAADHGAASTWPVTWYALELP